jgi:AcrR family transcriptional regulator
MKKSYLSRKEQIILSAIDIINKFGIDGLSIRELAKKENVTEGALYRHFKSKNDIIIEVLRYYSQYDIQIMNTIKNNKFDSKAGIIFFINSFSEYYENYPEITSVSCSYESLLYEPEIKKEVLQIINRRLKFLITIVEEGKNRGEIKLNLDSEDIADMIIGYFNQMIFKWRVEKYRFSLKEKIANILNIILS